MSKQKKTGQLGMNPATASGRLVKDILYALVVDTGNDICYRCGDFISREDLSIEHKEAWLDSDRPAELYFDLSNISFSHKSCNYSAARRPNQKYFTEEEKASAKNSQSRDAYAAIPVDIRKARRREQYLRTGS